MKKAFFLVILFIPFATILAQAPDFVPGYTVIFEDHFEQDPVGDLPAKWSTSGEGKVVSLDRLPGKWFRISQPTSVSPELAQALPGNCTIEFDLYLKNTTGIAPQVMFGLTTLSDVSSGDVYRNNIWVKCVGYNEAGSVQFGKTIQDLGNKEFRLSGFVGRKLHVSISVNNTRFRVWLDKEKVVDLPKLLTDEYRNNFFVACSEIVPASEEGVYFSNVRIASGDADARSLLVKQLLEQGSVVTNNITFDPNTNNVSPQAVPFLDTLGQTMVNNPTMNIQVNGADLGTGTPTIGSNIPASGSASTMQDMVKVKVDKMKSYLVEKFNIGTDRIVTGITTKVQEKAEKLRNSKTGQKITGFLTEIIKL